jgi:hypothetical protein
VTDPDWTLSETDLFTQPSPVQFVSPDNSVVTFVADADKTTIYSFTQEGADVRVNQAELTAMEAAPLNASQELIRNADSVAVAAATIAAIGTNTGTGTGTAVVFPSDYARSGEMDVAVAKLLAGSDSIDDPLLPDNFDSDFKDKFFKDAFTDLLSWQVPDHTSECPTALMEFDYFDQAFSLDFRSHCDILMNPDVSSVAEVCFLLLWYISALFIVLRA